MCRQLQNDRVDEEKKLAAEISYKLGKYYEERDGNLLDAINCFNETLSRKGDHKEAILAVARIN